MDPALPAYDDTLFHNINVEDFKEHYRDAEEPKPARMPKARGKPIRITCYCDASHAANVVTRRSHTGFIIFCNRAPIIWYSKRQSTVESSAFGAEFIALKTATEALMALRFKLRMFGVPLDGACRVFVDNESVVKNSSRIESVLNKKHNSVAYHVTRYATAAGIILVAWINTHSNIADALTKRLAAEKRNSLFYNVLY